MTFTIAVHEARQPPLGRSQGARRASGARHRRIPVLFRLLVWCVAVLLTVTLLPNDATQGLNRALAQATLDPSGVIMPCASNLTCPTGNECYMATTGLTCLPIDTTGCRVHPLPGGNYYTGPQAGIGSSCQRCPLPASPAQMQLLVDRYQQSVPGRIIRVALNGLGNCGPDAYCDEAQACRWRKRPLVTCDSSEQCFGTCIKNDAAGYSTCFDPYNPRTEAIQRLVYFGIFFGISLGLLVLAAVACLLAGKTRQRSEFRGCFVVAVLLALALMGVAVYWEASPWPFQRN